MSPKIYAVVYAALLGLLAATILAARVDMGVFNTVVAMAIACLKTLLVLLYFMHLRVGDKLGAMFFTTGLIMLVIVLLGLTLADYAGRAWLAG